MEYLTYQETADILKVFAKTVIASVEKGHLKSVIIGNENFIERDSLVDYICNKWYTHHKKDRILVYLRKNDSVSIPDQLEAIDKYCKSNKIKIYRILTETDPNYKDLNNQLITLDFNKIMIYGPKVLDNFYCMKTLLEYCGRRVITITSKTEEQNSNG